PRPIPSPPHSTPSIPITTTTSAKGDADASSRTAVIFSLVGLLLFLLIVATIIIIVLLVCKKRSKEEEDSGMEEGDQPKIIKIIIPRRKGKRKGKGKRSQAESSQDGKFRIPSKDINFKGPLKMKKRFHGEARHDYEDTDTSNQRVTEIVFDPSLNEAVAIGEGVEEYELQKSVDRATFSDTDRSEFLRVRDQDTPPKRIKKSRSKPS
ncbi:hypothetical protein PMAYCL1PPCAC_24351, partial [Pristionchus mayeri]